jgi:hypothetical protein
MAQMRPAQLRALEIKKVAPMNHRTPGQVVVTFEYSRHMGPKCEHGGVRLRFDSLRPYSFESRAQWPDDNYDAQVRAAVEHVLLERCGALALLIHPK